MVLSPDPIVTAVEIAEKLDMSQQNAHQRLQNLEDGGAVRSKKVGSRARVWWVTDHGKKLLRNEDA